MTDEELAAVLRWRGSALQEGAFFAAAVLIEQLTAERDRLREALGAFVAHYPKGINPDLDAACFAARAALKGETP